MLLQRNGVWTYRRVIPKDARAALGNKRQIWRSLGCTDLEQAKLRALQVGFKVERMIQEARQRLKVGSKVTPEAFALDWQRTALREDAEWRETTARTPERIETEVEALANALSDHREALDTSDTSLVSRLLREVLEQNGVKIPAHDHRRFALALLKARTHALGVALSRAESDERQAMVSDVLDAYLVQRKPPSKTEQEWRSVFRRWEVVNGLLLARDVQKLHVRAFRDSLAAMPSKRSSGGRVSAVTVRKGLAVVSSVFRWAVREGYIETAPTDGITGVRGSKTRDRERTRLPYSSDDLNTILAHLPTEQESPSKHYLPLLAMWTGARVEELCQLHVDDIGHEDGVSYLHIRGGDGRSVKTYSATRKVPLHPELERLGFLSYVKRQHGKPRLFMDLTAGPHGKLSHAYSKAWGRFTDGLGITDPRKTFHGFRHGMADALRRAGVELEVREALLGHSSGRVSAGYGSGHTLAAVFAQVQRVAFPGLELGRLRG